jgi:hypothetical protein
VRSHGYFPFTQNRSGGQGADDGNCCKVGGNLNRQLKSEEKAMASILLGKFLKLHLVLIVLLATTCLLVFAPGPAAAQQVFQTQLVDIYYQNPYDLREMEQRLDFCPTNDFTKCYFYTQDPVQAALSPGLAVKIDGLLVKVCQMLRRQPRPGQRLRIFLLQDGRQVRQRQLVLQPDHRQPFFFGYGSLEGFYELRTKTIFLSLADLRRGVLAHEMSHFVLCESSAVRPSEDLSEDWARYAESRLNEQLH